MNRIYLIAFPFSILMILLASSCTKTKSVNNSPPPNILYILADDLGYGELGSYGQKIIETPNLDALAKAGMRFTQHYSGSPVCAPSRCVLLTGQHTGHAFVRGNDEWKERGAVWNYQSMFDNPKLEGQRPLPDSVITLAEILKTKGYTTGLVGKWGLGAPESEGTPNKQGFDFFYGYNCQRQAHTLYPMHLWRNEERHLLDNKMVAPHSKFPKGADSSDPANYADYNLKQYAPELMLEESLQFIQRNKAKPFFLYFASPLPHLPLQAPPHWVDHYRKKLGEEEPYTKGSYFPCQYPRATYAAMISYLDEQVGALIKELKQQGLYENTLIIFSSDNGPTYTGGADTPYFDSAQPFKTEYGWAKGFVHEGGLRVPMIAAWPGQITANTVSDHISAFQDVLPTCCELAGANPPAATDGISFLPSLLGKHQKEHAYLYWEFPAYKGQQAIRMGNWKGIRKNILDGNIAMELYDLSKDKQESYNLADSLPKIVNELQMLMANSRTRPATEGFRMEALGD